MVKKKALSNSIVESEPTVFESLDSIQLDFDCGVAVWLKDSRTLSNEMVQFINMKAMEFGCMSQCPKFRLRTEQYGVIYLFGNKRKALEFCIPLSDARSPHGDFPFVAEHLGTYLRIVAEIEDQTPLQCNLTETNIIIRNLDPARRVMRRVLNLCSLFGNVLNHEEFLDVGSSFQFRHVVVSYRYAVQAFAAKLGLDGKWIYEQKHPLAVEVDSDAKVKFIYQQLVKLNQMLFHS